MQTLRPPEEIKRGCQLIEQMMLIRQFEEVAARENLAGSIRGPVHQSIGQEAVAVGVCVNLRRDDLLQSNHRGHGHAIAKGAQPETMMLELFGRASGTNGGKGGSMHIADFSVGMMGTNGILGDGVTLGVGAAHAIKLRREDRIVVAFVGDGTVNRGVFYEGLNWAKVFTLPFLLVCEDNLYASSTLTKDMTAGPGPAARAEAFGVPATVVDGNDLFAVDAAAQGLIHRVRNGAGPQFLLAKTYRIKGHISRDPLRYRAAGETEQWWAAEPIGRASRQLEALGVPPAEFAAMHTRVTQRIEEAVERARHAAPPERRAAYEDVQDEGAEPCPY